ncbi:MAG: diguanylate cyclase [Chloroflexi bacterium]|nr:diguanylate cyclase [Chloroflexota bacterium]
MTTPAPEFYRLDPLTGCYNFLSFVETLDQFSSGDGHQPFSILYLDMNHVAMLNKTKGHAYGDSVIRWLGIALQEESASPTYRIGGDDFAAILTDGSHTDYEELLNRIFGRLNREGAQLGIPSPPARIALIHYGMDRQFSINDVMFHLWEAILNVKRNNASTISIFYARDLIRSTARAEEQRPEGIHHSWEVLQSIANQAINRVVSMGQVLDAAQKTSFLDSISGLPNMRAALYKIEKELSSKQPFAILLMDGDELTRYNHISYAVGDDMIQKIGAVLSEKLRPGDFIARWRSGDEFIAILPNTTGEGAVIVGERFCAAIREASKAWRFPTSITIGIAIHPRHGETSNSLVDAAESALKKGKDAGKDRAILAG